MADQKLGYGRYTLVMRQIREGWGAWIEDPAGHVADVPLHDHLGLPGWASLEEARQAAERFVDDLQEEESSY